VTRKSRPIPKRKHDFAYFLTETARGKKALRKAGLK
jgi:hypothetical protein